MTAAAVAKVADGKVYVAHEAVLHNLADGVSTFDQVVNRLGKPEHREEYKAAAPQLDVAARARVYIAQQERLGRRVTAAQACAHINSL